MLARRSVLKLPDNSPLDLPLLVPSFSSKGFGFTRHGRGKAKHPVSHIAVDLHEFSKAACQAVLISAYDLHFGHFKGPGELKGGPLQWLDKPRLIFLDSGGYELASDFDSSEPKTPVYVPREGYGSKEYGEVVERLKNDPMHRCFAITNFDHSAKPRTLQSQIESARRLFQRVPDQLHSVIVKPWERSCGIDPERISRKEIKSLAGFDIIGFTEKELGTSPFERLQRIAQWRSALDAVDIAAPIHVWGGLDPVMTPLYFFAGAEIFDGVSWLRYSYIDGIAVNRECFPVLSEDFDITTNHDVCRQVVSLRNKGVLDGLSGQLKRWVDGGGADFGMFAPKLRERLEATYAIMVSNIPELKKEVR